MEVCNKQRVAFTFPTLSLQRSSQYFIRLRQTFCKFVCYYVILSLANEMIELVRIDEV